MPAVNPRFVGAVAFVYPDTASANLGDSYGGCGFFVGVPFDTIDGSRHLYFVTAAHVAGQGSVLRIRRRNATHEIVELPPDAWNYHPDGDDVAIAPIGLPRRDHEHDFIPSSAFWSLPAEDSWRSQEGLPLGCDVYYVGRYIDPRRKRQLDDPTVRFGVVSTPPVPVEIEGLTQQVLLVEVRSLAGYSGSPVFVVPFEFEELQYVPTNPMVYAQLLGLDCGHYRRFSPILEKPGGKPIARDWCIEENSGLMMVQSVEKIQRILDSEELRAMRERDEKEIRESSEGISLDVSKPGPKPERLKLDEGYEDAVEKALKKEKPEEGWPED